MKPRYPSMIASGAMALILTVGAGQAGEIQSDRLLLHHDPGSGVVELSQIGGKKQSLRFSVPPGVGEDVHDGAMNLKLDGGAVLRIALPNGAPFALLRATLRNETTQQKNIPHFRMPEMTVDLGVEPAKVLALGTAGLTKPDGHPGSYVFLALADPETRAGVVAAWTTFNKADGVLFSGVRGGKLTLAAQNDYGRLLVEPGTSVDGETLALGFFGDVRRGLEQWADLTARLNDIHLLPQESGYCTWYSQPNGGASDEKHIRELSAFAARELKPWGFDYIQIDDKWQDGERRHGPAKVFERVNPKGPYPSGMKAAADAIRGDGLIAGIWYMPFAGDQDDPWFADKQDWFAKRPDGSVYWTSWGGGSLDLTNPKVQAYVKNLARRIGRDWGYKLFKLDGLWTGLANAQLYVNNGYKPDDLGEAKVHDPSKTPFEAYRNAFRLLREGAGKDVYILGCNVSQNMRTLGAVIGCVDSMRIGPDNGSSWKALQRGPWHGSNRWFFNKRIWYNDPDPIYVRPSVPLNHARAITSWVAVTGMHNACSEWLPGLPKDRLDLIRRSLPPHRFAARPADVLERDLARIWVAADEKSGRYVVGLFNWNDNEPWHVEYPLEKLGLPGGGMWVGKEYWSGAEIAPFKGQLVADVAPGACHVISLRKLALHPMVLASSRHITQGLTDLSGETWDPKAKKLVATTDLVANDPTTLTIFALAKPGGKPGAWVPGTPEVSAQGVKAEVKCHGPVLTLTLTSPVSRKVSWALPFSDPKPVKAAQTPKNLRAGDMGFGKARIVWDGGDADHWKLERDGGATLILDKPEFLDEALVPGKKHVYRVSVCGGGEAVLELKAPATPEAGPVPPKPDVYLSDLKAAKLTTGHGKAKLDRSIEGKPLTIEGKRYKRGLGVHADSVARYPLKPEYKRFVAVAGLDDEKKYQKDGSVVFVVRITREDGTTEEVSRSPVLRWDGLGHWHFDLPIPEGARAIELVVNDAGDGNRCDHADWAQAGFVTKK